MADFDGAVIATIERQALQREAIAYTSLTGLPLKQSPDRPRQLEAEARRWAGKSSGTSLRSIAQADDMPELLAALKQRRERLQDVEREQAVLVATPPRLSLRRDTLNVRRAVGALQRTAARKRACSAPGAAEAAAAAAPRKPGDG